MDNIIAKLLAWWQGIPKGTTRYIRASPFIVGELIHLVPFKCLDDTEKNTLRFRVHQEEWDGSKWKHVTTLELSKSALSKRFNEAQNE